MAFKAYGFPTATFVMTCSLMFHGPGLNENSISRGQVKGSRS